MGLVNDYQPVSNYLKAADIVGVQMVLTISSIGEATFDDGKKQPTIAFHETEKTLGLNKTNREKLAELFGQPSPVTGTLDVEPADIIGQKICVYKTTTQDKSGATVPCVRIRSASMVKQGNQLSRPAAPPSAPVSVTKESAWQHVLKSCNNDREQATKKWGELIKTHGVNYAAFLQTPDTAPPSDLGVDENGIPF